MEVSKIRKFCKHNLNPIIGYRYTSKGGIKVIGKSLIKKK